MDPHSPAVKRIGRTPRNTERISGDDRWAAIELLARRPIFGGSVAPLPPAARASSAGPIRASAPVHRRASPGVRISCLPLRDRAWQMPQCGGGLHSGVHNYISMYIRGGINTRTPSAGRRITAQTGGSNTDRGCTRATTVTRIYLMYAYLMFSLNLSYVPWNWKSTRAFPAPLYYSCHVHQGGPFHSCGRSPRPAPHQTFQSILAKLVGGGPAPWHGPAACQLAWGARAGQGAGDNGLQ